MATQRRVTFCTGTREIRQRPVVIQVEACAACSQQLMLRIHGDGTLLRSLLRNEQKTNAYSPEDRSHQPLVIENDLHYRQDPFTLAIHSQSR